jgi:hypothetical protein
MALDPQETSQKSLDQIRKKLAKKTTIEQIPDHAPKRKNKLSKNLQVLKIM